VFLDAFEWAIGEFKDSFVAEVGICREEFHSCGAAANVTVEVMGIVTRSGRAVL
jgi:hypothetical protein